MSMDMLQHPQPYEFVGGPYDGRTLAVAPPAEDGTELVVHSVGRFAPAEFYVLRNDGRFHFNAQARGGSLELLAVD
jgi:hypothetical protein